MTSILWNRLFSPAALPMLLLCLLCGCAGMQATHRISSHPVPIPTDYLPATSEEVAAMPPELQEYYRIWKEAKAALPEEDATTADFTVHPLFPPSARQLHITTDIFHRSQLKLLKCLSAAHASPQRAKPQHLEALMGCHAVQEQLCRIYHAMDQMQHGGSALPAKELLDALTLLQALATAPETCDIAACDEATQVADALSEWRLLWKGKTPVLTLGGQWAVTNGPADSWHYQPVAAGPTFFFSAPAGKKAGDFLKESAFDASGEEMLCLRQLFERPFLAPGQQLYLITPPLPSTVQLSINGVTIPLNDGSVTAHPHAPRCHCLNIDDYIDPTILLQRISVQMPAKAIGTPILPLCLGASDLVTGGNAQ